MADVLKALHAGKDAKAAANPDSEYARIRAIDVASEQMFGKGASDAKFAWRNEQRAAQGLPPEKRDRGGLAGQWDEGELAPFLAVAAAPLAMSALGGTGAAGGTASGGTAASMGGIPPIPAAGGVGGAAGGIGGAAGGAAPWSLGGLAGKAGDWFKDPSNILKLGAGAYGITQQQKGAGMMTDALERDKARWAQGGPLREAGAAGMLNPIPADTSSLGALAGQGNPFAAKKLPPLPAGGR